MKRLLVTSGLPYSNGQLHVGHVAGAYLPADIYVRYKRLTGTEVHFVCGSDDHGVAIMLSAEKEKKTPAEIANHYNELQKKDFEGLRICFDVYGATSCSKYHQKASQDFFLHLHKKNYFEKKKTKQYYDQLKKVFLPDRFVKGTCGHCKTPDQHGDQCENCGKVLDVDTLEEAVSVLSGQKASIRETVHWFLDLTKFQKTVATWVGQAKMRETTRRYVKSLLAQGLVKRSMTRDIDWGIPVPLEEPDAKGKVLYVWFDAPIGYISNTMELCEQKYGDAQKYEDWWKSKDTEIIHFIGEDNTVFHCVIWIAMLSAEETFQLPTGVVVNQFLNIKFPEKEVEKISKSRGTAVWIGDYLEQKGDPDVLRYYLTAIAPERARTVFKPEDLVKRNNTDLANTLGNFVNRVLSFTHKYVGPHIPEYPENKVTKIDEMFLNRIQDTHKRLTDELEKFSFKAAMETIIEFCRDCNKYIDEKAPWVTRKEDMETTKVTLVNGLRAIHFLAITLLPFLPGAAQKIANILNLDRQKLTWKEALKPLPSGSKLNSPEILFSKLEV